MVYHSHMYICIYIYICVVYHSHIYICIMGALACGLLDSVKLECSDVRAANYPSSATPPIRVLSLGLYVKPNTALDRRLRAERPELEDASHQLGRGRLCHLGQLEVYFGTDSPQR